MFTFAGVTCAAAFERENLVVSYQGPRTLFKDQLLEFEGVIWQFVSAGPSPYNNHLMNARFARAD